jgi:hypothetical protein
MASAPQRPDSEDLFCLSSPTSPGSACQLTGWISDISMTSVVCTLFEGDYHLGVGALVNSLYRFGFRGDVWAGYKGSLPEWVTTDALQDRAGTTLRVTSELTIHFVEISADSHLTNYKPYFMSEVLKNYSTSCDSLFYFDPDIVIGVPWTFFEEWTEAGIALCEDVSSPLPVRHPLRMKWKRFYEARGVALVGLSDLFFNGGFVGLRREHQSFLDSWAISLELMSDTIGGLRSMFVGDRSFLFHVPDQDALNIACMETSSAISPIGKEGMSFKPGWPVMFHATGTPKPWRSCMLLRAFKGRSPTQADRRYWQNVRHPIALYPLIELLLHVFDVRAASVVGRYLARR